MKALIAGAAVITGLVASFLPISDATAQAYRCGRVYQDHPCDGNLSAKSVSGSSHRSGSTNSNGAPIHPICQQRGEDSLKIIWAREAGAVPRTWNASIERNPPWSGKSATVAVDGGFQNRAAAGVG